MSTGDGIEADIDGDAGDRPAVSISRTCPDRTVFAEQGNTDAWISTDLTVDIER